MLARCRYIIAIAVAMLLFALTAEGKVYREKVAINSLTRVSHIASTGMNIWVEVTNKSCCRLVIKSATIEVKVDSLERLEITLRDKVVIPRRSNKEICLPIRLKGRSNPLFIFTRLLEEVAMGDRANITIDYDIRAGNSLIKRRFSDEDVALETLLESLDPIKGQIESITNLVNNR